MNKMYGKYRGTVINNIDPAQIARIQALVPAISGVALSSWALPCLPIAGIQTGVVGVPPVGAGVWIEFEGGDTDYPVWSGCFFGSVNEVPALHTATPPAIGAVTVQTPLQNGLTVTDLPGPTGGIVLKSATGASVIVNDTGIYIQNGRGASITLVGPTVAINSGALTVT